MNLLIKLGCLLSREMNQKENKKMFTYWFFSRLNWIEFESPKEGGGTRHELFLSTIKKQTSILQLIEMYEKKKLTTTREREIFYANKFSCFRFFDFQNADLIRL